MKKWQFRFQLSNKRLFKLPFQESIKKLLNALEKKLLKFKKSLQKRILQIELKLKFKSSTESQPLRFQFTLLLKKLLRFLKSLKKLLRELLFYLKLLKS